MTQDLEFEFRNRDFPLLDLFHIYENPDQAVLNQECFIIRNEKAKYYHSKNNNLMPTRFELVLLPKYEMWEDQPGKLNMVAYQQAMELFEHILNEAIHNHNESSPMAASLKDIQVFSGLILQVPVSLLDSSQIDSVHMANMYRKYKQNFN